MGVRLATAKQQKQYFNYIVLDPEIVTFLFATVLALTTREECWYRIICHQDSRLHTQCKFTITVILLSKWLRRAISGFAFCLSKIEFYLKVVFEISIYVYNETRKVLLNGDSVLKDSLCLKVFPLFAVH